MWYPTKEMMITQTPKWKLVILHHVASVLGVLIKYEGWPMGSNRNMDFSQNTGGASVLGASALQPSQTTEATYRSIADKLQSSTE